MYVFKDLNSNEYITGTGYNSRLTPDINQARTYQKPNAAFPWVSNKFRKRAPGGQVLALDFIPVKIQVREERYLTDRGEDE